MDDLDLDGSVQLKWEAWTAPVFAFAMYAAEKWWRSESDMQASVAAALGATAGLWIWLVNLQKVFSYRLGLAHERARRLEERVEGLMQRNSP